MSYLVTSYWRGSLHIDTMRSFSERDQAWTYYDSLQGNEAVKRIYEVSSSGPPKKLNPNKR